MPCYIRREPWQWVYCYSWHSQYLTTSWLLLFEAKCQCYASQTRILIAKNTLGNKINTPKRCLRNLDKFLIECNHLQKFIKNKNKSFKFSFTFLFLLSVTFISFLPYKLGYLSFLSSFYIFYPCSISLFRIYIYFLICDLTPWLSFNITISVYSFLSFSRSHLRT